MDLSNGHQLAQMTVTPMTMAQIGGETRAVPDPTRETETRVGCMVCEAGLEEALELPCMGMTTEELLERAGDDLD